MPEPRPDSTDRPWYETPSTVISALALIISICVAVVTYLGDNEETRRNQQTRLTEIIERLMEVDLRAAQLVASGSRGQNIENASIMLANQRMGLLESAERLLSSIRGDVTPTEYAVLAVSFGVAGNYERAERYMRLYADNAVRPLDRAVALRSLANLYVVWGPKRLPEARAKYREANELLKAQGAAFTELARADVLAMWGRTELAYGFYDEALELFVEAANTVANGVCEETRGVRLAQYEALMSQIVAVHPEGVTILATRVAPQRPCIFDPMSTRRSGADAGDSMSDGRVQAEEVGVYEFEWALAVVSEDREGRLRLLMPRQPSYVLERSAGSDGYLVEGLGYEVRFERSPDGSIQALSVVQPEGTFIARRRSILD